MTSTGKDHDHPRYRTANGEPVVIGLRVFTNDLKLGTVVAIDRDGDGWHDVLEDGRDSPRGFDGGRMTTVHPFTRELAR